jgi:excisionase family DNA binding protein
LQAFILDGSNVIDYVQLCGPNSSGGVNQVLADPNYPQPNNIYYQWSTNAVPYAPPTPYSVQEAADMLGVHYFSVYRLIQRGKLKTCHALRGKILVPRTELLKLLETDLR